jgi:hypothetical protein
MSTHSITPDARVAPASPPGPDVPMPGATAGVDMPYAVPSSAPTWSDPAMIARLANGFFQSPPNQPVSSPPSPGVPVAPPSPAMMPAPSVVTTIAPFAPASPGMGPPSIPPTTIPSYVPTPNISVPLVSQPPAGPLGASDLPQPGASQESFNPLGFSPSGHAVADLAQRSYPPEHPVSRGSKPPDAPSFTQNLPFSVPGGAAHVPSDMPYFLAEMPSSVASSGQPASATTPDLPRGLYPAITPDAAGACASRPAGRGARCVDDDHPVLHPHPSPAGAGLAAVIRASRGAGRSAAGRVGQFLHPVRH